MEAEKFDYLYKILLLGNSRAGKTAFLTQYVEGTFTPSFIPTIGIDFRVKLMTTKSEKKIKLQIWDTSGQERFRAITTAYYHGAMGFIVMFDLTDKESFLACRNWVKRVKEETSEDRVILLVGNKLDLSEERQVSTEEIEDLSQSLGIHFFETSAKENTNIYDSLEYLVDLISVKIGR